MSYKAPVVVEKNQARYSGGRNGLDAQLRAKVNPDMDILEFLALAGWRAPPKEMFSEWRMNNEMQARYRRRTWLTRSDRCYEIQFVGSMERVHDQGTYTTIEEIRGLIEKKGNVVPQMSFDGLMRFNDVLRQYGIQPILKVGGYVTPRELSGYGLEPSDHNQTVRRLNLLSELLPSV